MVFYLTKYYLDFVFINLYLIRYYLDSKLGKLPILCTVSVNMETSIPKLGRVLFNNTSYVRTTLFFTKSCTLLKMVKKIIFLKENAVFNIVSHSLLSIKHRFPAITAYFKDILSSKVPLQIT